MNAAPKQRIDIFVLHTFLLAVAPLADLHGGGEAEAGDRHVHGDPRRHLGVLCDQENGGKF